MAAGCVGLHRHQGGREGGTHPTPRVSFREWVGQSCSRPGGVMWVLADVVGDVHLATLKAPGSVDLAFLGPWRGPQLEAWQVPGRYYGYWDS
jgi:hypothetical protein